MKELASRSQLRMSFLRWALFCVSLILLLGIGSGVISNSGYQNSWFAGLAKPAAIPPGGAFGIVWTGLYILLGLALAVIVGARGAPGRGLAIALFWVQMLLNFAWSPLFFALHEISLAFYLLLAILLLSLVTTLLFARIRVVAGLLMLPYLLWIVFAAYLVFEIDRLNPYGGRVVMPSVSTQI
jgi:translocator protein